MKKIVLLILLLSPWLFGATLNMAQFRLQQRHLVLAEFKSLYKQRHYYQHRANALRHHRRVKVIGKHSIWTHTHSEAKQDAAMPQQGMHENDLMSGQESNIKTKANHDMEWIKQKETGHGMPNLDQPINPPYNNSSDGGDMPMDGGSYDSGNLMPSGTGEGSMPENPVDGGHYNSGDGIPSGGSDIPSMPENKINGSDMPMDGGGYDSGNLMPSGTGEGTTPENPLDGGHDDSGGIIPTGPGDGSQGYTSAPAPDSGSVEKTGQEEAQKSGDTAQMPLTDDVLRPRFADPWRRR